MQGELQCNTSLRGAVAAADARCLIRSPIDDQTHRCAAPVAVWLRPQQGTTSGGSYAVTGRACICCEVGSDRIRSGQRQACWNPERGSPSWQDSIDVGVFAASAAEDSRAPVRDGDRIEIYRPLTVDRKRPRVARRVKGR